MREDYFRKGLVISIIILFIGTNIVPNICGNNEDKEYFTYESGNLTITYHLATREEIEEMKKDEGVYDPDKNYNHIVNGKGTGLLPPTEEEWDAMVGTLKIADKVHQPLLLRSEKDLTQDYCFPAVGDQGTQNSCVAWALTYYTNGYIQAQQHNWNEAHRNNPNHTLSPAWTYNKCRGENPGASFIDVAWCMNKTGACTNYTMPYNESDPRSWGEPEAWRDAPQYRCGDYFEITKTAGNYTDEDVTLIKAKINDGVPVAFGMGTGIYAGLRKGPPIDEVLGVNEMLSGGDHHANTFVGFDDNIKNPNGPEEGAFKVINSWGKGPWPFPLFGDWDSDGCYWITYDAFKEGKCLYSSRYIEDYYTNDDYPNLIGVWEFSRCPPRNTSVKLSLWDRDVGGDPNDTREPYWVPKDPTDNRFPYFMCLDVTEFFDTWAFSGDIFNFSIDLGELGQEWLEGKKIESFVIEYYEDEYSLGEPSQKSRKTEPDLEEPLDLPCRVYVKDFNHSTPPYGLNLTGTFDNIEGGRIYDDPPYNFSAKDWDVGDELYYYWDWGDGNNTGWLGPFQSGEVDPQEKGWEFHGTYYMTVIAEDKGGFRNVTEKTINVTGDNDKPNDPNKPTMEKKQGNTYYLNTTTTDPEENDVFYCWEFRRWNRWKLRWEHSGTGWVNKPYASGENHTYEYEFEKGTWQVKVKAKDIWGDKYNTTWSPWSDETRVNYASGCPEGTQVNIAQGSFPVTKNIENIVVGDIIQSYDVTNELLVPAEVIAVHEYTQELPETLLDINYNSGDVGVTLDHFLFINGTGWIETGDARIGYYLLENPPGTGDTFLKQITSINESSPIAASIYDLEIIPVTSENVSGYFADSVLVGGFI